jgi:AbiTii
MATPLLFQTIASFTAAQLRGTRFSAGSKLEGPLMRLQSEETGNQLPHLNTLAQADKETTFHVRYSDAICQRLDKQNGVRGWGWALEVSGAELAKILDRVRTLILEWAINLERIGVVGSDISFNSAEKEKAKQSAMTVNIGIIHSFTGNLGQDNIAGDIAVGTIHLGQVHDLVGQLKQHADELAGAGVDHKQLEQRIAALEAELAKTAPNQSAIRGLLVELRGGLVGAVANLVASGAVNLLNQILGTGVPIA